MKIILRKPEDVEQAISAIRALKFRTPKEITIESYNSRTIEQNRQQWPILQAFADQMLWDVGGEKQQLSADDWKDILTASYAGERLRFSPTLDKQRMVALGLRTSKFHRTADTDEDTAWADWMAFLNWAVAEYGIRVPLPKHQAARYE